jgi:diketogulonate reductase-like aldo/keto reductase
MSACPFLTFNNGNKIPQFGLGTFEISNCTESVLEAFKIGYRHLDTAHFYGNEKEVGEAVLKSGLKREDIFVTSKIWPTEFDHAEKALTDMFKRINLTYIDLVLLHWPYGDYVSAWKALEKFVKEGKIKNIGLSNFYGDDLKKILEICTIKPVCDQVECHLYKNKLEFKKQLDKEKMVLVAYCPVRHIDEALKNNKDIVKIMEKYKKNIYQIVLKWHIQNGYIPIPKASNVEHMKSNFNIFDFELTSDEMKALNSIPQKTEGDPDDETRKWVLSHPPKED